MGTFEVFEQYLQDGLTHLYSPTYHPPELLQMVLGKSSQQGVESVQVALIKAIEALAPAPNVPANARSRRVYEVLLYRYVEGMTQKETAQRLGITPRYLRREQQRAVQALAQRLWEQREGKTVATPQMIPDSTPTDEGTPSQVTGEAVARRSQIKQELEVLQQSAPGAFADVGEVIQSAVKLGEALASKHEVSLNVNLISAGLMVTIHPSLLREVLITTIDKLVPHMTCGEIIFQAEQKQKQVMISIIGCPATVESSIHSDFIREALAAHGGSVRVNVQEDSIIFLLMLPSADKVKVLAIEDNADLVRFYRRYVARTRYEIIHIAEGRHIFEKIIEIKPDIILLDILLPDIDGWELLNQLHEHPATRSIPVIVCSVVRREEMSLALGASLYLQKPVRLEQFIQALDQVLDQTAIKSPKI
jgi:CheY-like chemotaxis protein